MAKRQFLMLAHTLDDLDKQLLQGWFMSEKLDGLRMFWDGGISRGLMAKEVPFANVERDARLIDQDYKATGLWSRNAKVIRAPDWFLEKLPKGIPLDGEIWGGRGKWEVTSSITKQNVPNESDWRQIKYMVFDSPDLNVVFDEGHIETDIYDKIFDVSVLSWVHQRLLPGPGLVLAHHNFETRLSQLTRCQEIQNEYVRILPQTMLPYATSEACKAIINQEMSRIVGMGGEGLMLRAPQSLWLPQRSHQLLKVKRWYDSEATVVGYAWGRKTEKGSKHLGKMGALVVKDADGKIFELSGFKDVEREMTFINDGTTAFNIGRTQPGMFVVDANIHNPKFPIGTVVTYRYRELTAIGIPKSAIYLRIKNGT